MFIPTDSGAALNSSSDILMLTLLFMKRSMTAL